MRVVLGTPIYNDVQFIDNHVKNALGVGYDEIVYLDDGSTDGSYEKLCAYANIYPHIHVFKHKVNSVLSNTLNRWQIVSYKCREFEPDWIMVRAVDEILSFKATIAGGDLLRKNLTILLQDTDVVMVAFPVVHLWRSPWWFRSDGEWGYSAMNGVSDSCWRNDSGWEFVRGYTRSGIHIGGHRPNKFRNGRLIKKDINLDKLDVPNIVVLHYGMSDYKLIYNKLRYQFDTANKIGIRAVGVPPTSVMPHPSQWKAFNGYKIAYELDLKLTRVYDNWFESKVPEVSRPPMISFYELIKLYNQDMANEYRQLYKDIMKEN